MNKLIFRKFSVDILTFFLLSSLSISSIVWVIQGVNLLDIVSEQGHELKVYFIYSILNFPKIFSKLMMFTYFLTLFVVISRYEDNNEILIFWVNGIKKITFINFIAKFSLIILLIQFIFNLYIVPYTQNLAQEYLKISSVDFFPKILQEKKFSNIKQDLTIFVDKNSEDGGLKGIYIKEKLKNNQNKIIIASRGRIFKESDGYNFKLSDGKIINLDTKGNFNLGFKETNYDLSKINSKTRKEKKIDEVESKFLLNCLEENINLRKDEKFRCGYENSFLLKDIYEEIFKRFINPIYIIIISLISSLIIMKNKIQRLQNYFKFFLFICGFSILIFSELTYRFIFSKSHIELLIIALPIICIFIFYIFILIKSKFKLSLL